MLCYFARRAELFVSSATPRQPVICEHVSHGTSRVQVSVRCIVVGELVVSRRPELRVRGSAGDSRRSYLPSLHIFGSRNLGPSPKSVKLASSKLGSIVDLRMLQLLHVQGCQSSYGRKS